MAYTWTINEGGSISLAERDSDATGLVGKEGYAVAVDGSGDYTLAAQYGTDFRGVCTSGGIAATDRCGAHVGFMPAVISGEALSEGDLLTIDSTARFITANAAADRVVGVALADCGAANEWVRAYIYPKVESLSLSAAAEVANTIAVTVTCGVESASLLALVVPEATGIPNNGAFKVDETGVGAEVLPAAGGGAFLVFTTNASGAATLTVTDVAGASGLRALLMVWPLSNPYINAAYVGMAFD